MLKFSDLKKSVLAEMGLPDTKLIRTYWSQITFFFDDAHKTAKLDFRTKATWELVKRYALRIKTLHQKATVAPVEVFNWRENVKNRFQHLTTPTGRGQAAKVAEEFSRLGSK